MPAEVSKQVGVVDIGMVSRNSIWNFFGIVLREYGERGESGQG
jgi:hypothetical protein